MNERAKEKLYEQLLEMAEANKKEDSIALISREQYMSFTEGQALSYIFWYRDTQTYFETENTDIRTNKTTVTPQEYYIALPDMNLEGQDLSTTVLTKEEIGASEDVLGVKLSRFELKMPDESGEMQPTNVNLRGTNADINLFRLRPERYEINDNGFRRYVLDFSQCDFRGCNVHGILFDEYENEAERQRYMSGTVIPELDLTLRKIRKRI